VLDLEHVSANQRRGFCDRIGMQRARVQQTTQSNFVHRHSRAFFAQHMGGPCEAIVEDLEGSSHEVRAGADILTDLGVIKQAMDMV
jgi:hypothetical protein